MDPEDLGIPEEDNSFFSASSCPGESLFSTGESEYNPDGYIQWCQDCSVLLCLLCDDRHSAHDITKIALNTRRVDLEVGDESPDEYERRKKGCMAEIKMSFVSKKFRNEFDRNLNTI